MASLPADECENVLWALIESRDRAFAAAHQLFHRQLNDKENKIKALTDVNRDLQEQLAEKEQEIAEKEAEIGSKEAEILSVTEAGAARQAVIDELKASKEYRLGLILCHPWEVLRSKL
jgi:chromosome segregation ATPase